MSSSHRHLGSVNRAVRAGSRLAHGPLLGRDGYLLLDTTCSEPCARHSYGFRGGQRRPSSEGVKGTAGGGGEDKERSGTGAALTPEQPALQESGPSTRRACHEQARYRRNSDKSARQTMASTDDNNILAWRTIMSWARRSIPSRARRLLSSTRAAAPITTSAFSTASNNPLKRPG